MSPPPEQQIEVSPAELAALRESEAGEMRLVDCREDDEWQLCHIDGAELVPLSQFAERTSGWDSAEAPLMVVYCHHGMRSLQATEYLRARGFAKTFSLAGGIEAWSLEVDPTVPRY